MNSIAVLEGRPTSSMPESDLIRAYSAGLSPVIRICPCVCGGMIEAPSDDWPLIAQAIAVHNESTPHRQWRERVGL